jgi:hypothetical protein
MPQVIGIQKGYELSARHTQPQVAGRGRPGVGLSEVDDLFPIAGRYGGRAVGRAIVRDDYFQRAKRLGKDSFYRFA